MTRTLAALACFLFGLSGWSQSATAELVDLALTSDCPGVGLWPRAIDAHGRQWQILGDAYAEGLLDPIQPEEAFPRDGHWLRDTEAGCHLDPAGAWRCPHSIDFERDWQGGLESLEIIAPPLGQYRKLSGGRPDLHCEDERWVALRSDGRLIFGPTYTLHANRTVWLVYPDRYVDFSFGDVLCGLTTAGRIRCYPDAVQVEVEIARQGLPAYVHFYPDERVAGWLKQVRTRGIQFLPADESVDPRATFDPLPPTTDAPFEGTAELPVPPGRGYTRLEVSRSTPRTPATDPWHACALTQAGALDCFGDEGWRLRHPGPFRDVTLQQGALCALGASGVPRCFAGPWRDYRSTAIEPPPEASHIERSPVPIRPDVRPVLHAPPQPFKAIRLGDQIGVGLLPDGTLTIWGDAPPFAVFGDKFRWHPGWPPLVEAPVHQYAVGEDFGCAVLANQRVVCWGQNRWGQAAPPALRATAVAAGRRHACALTANTGEVRCWGEYREHQRRAPAGHFRALWAVDDTTCAQPMVGAVVCWGGDAGPAPDSDLTGALRPDLVGETVADFPGAEGRRPGELPVHYWTSELAQPWEYLEDPLRNTAWRGLDADEQAPILPDPTDRLPQWRPDLWEGPTWLEPQDVPPYPVPE